MDMGKRNGLMAQVIQANLKMALFMEMEEEHGMMEESMKANLH